MAHTWNRNRARPQKRCWCGSGKKEKNCHGLRPDTAVPTELAGLRPLGVTRQPQITTHPWGVPGEEHKLIVVPLMKGAARPGAADISGQQGKYRVQFLLSRPGHPVAKEREHKFIDDIVGTSHLKIVKPEAERGPQDADRLLLGVPGKHYQIVGIADEGGFLGKVVFELDAENSQ